jgi:hypothetical protein
MNAVIPEAAQRLSGIHIHRPCSNGDDSGYRFRVRAARAPE